MKYLDSVTKLHKFFTQLRWRTTFFPLPVEFCVILDTLWCQIMALLSWISTNKAPSAEDLLGGPDHPSKDA